MSNYRAVSIYDKATGLFTGRTVGGVGFSDELLDAHLGDGEGWVDGKHDHLSRKVDVATGQIVDHRPPQPSTEHEWNGDAKRWRLSAAAQTKTDSIAAAKARYAALIEAQHDDVRRALLGDQEAIARLKTIEAEVQTLRGSNE